MTAAHSQSATTMVDCRICRHSDEDPTWTAMFPQRFSTVVGSMSEGKRWMGELQLERQLKVGVIWPDARLADQSARYLSTEQQVCKVSLGWSGSARGGA